MHPSLFSMRARLAASPAVAKAFFGVLTCLVPLASVTLWHGSGTEAVLGIRPPASPVAFSPSQPKRVESDSAEARLVVALPPQAQDRLAAAPLPRILSAQDAERYHRVFALQQAGRFKAADEVIAELGDRLLMGHVLAQRFLRTRRPDYEQMRLWLAKHPGHPDAWRIYRLARKLQPRGARWPRVPRTKQTSLAAEIRPPPPYVSKKNLTAKQQQRVRYLKRVMRIWLERNYIRKTERLIARADVQALFDRYELDEARAKVAAAWFYQGEDRKAYTLAAAALAGSGRKLPLANWTAGLAAWRLGRIAEAAEHFEALAARTDLSGWVVAGAALWAARASSGLDQPDVARHWLSEAARYPFTIYGVMALATLGREIPFDHRTPTFTAAMAGRLAATPHGRRALALLEAGQDRRAEQELLTLEHWDRPGLREALLALANHASLPSIALKTARRLASDGDEGRRDEPLHDALYPIPPWRAALGSDIDQALLFAIMRQESDFNAFAVSPVGAQGLMQLMPPTARAMNHGRRFRGARRLDGFDPDINVRLGQRYLHVLRYNPLVRGDMLRLIAAYNSGPGNVDYWTREKIEHGGDPLMFIETVPKRETRLFVRRVLANLWIYRYRLGQGAPSLAAIIAGRFPRYRPIDRQHAPQLAERPQYADEG